MKKTRLQSRRPLGPNLGRLKSGVESARWEVIEVAIGGPVSGGVELLIA